MSIQAVLEITQDDPLDKNKNPAKASSRDLNNGSPLLNNNPPGKKKEFVALSAGGVTIRCKLLKGVMVYPHAAIAGNPTPHPIPLTPPHPIGRTLPQP